MDLLITATVFVGTLIAGNVGNLIASELYDSGPSIARWLIDRAVNRLPEEDRLERKEEWLADNNDYPGKLRKVGRAFGYLIASWRMRLASWRTRFSPSKKFDVRSYWLIERAVLQLPEEFQDRYREEWLADTTTRRGSITKLAHALGCLLGSRSIRKNMA